MDSRACLRSEAAEKHEESKENLGYEFGAMASVIEKEDASDKYFAAEDDSLEEEEEQDSKACSDDYVKDVSDVQTLEVGTDQKCSSSSSSDESSSEKPRVEKFDSRAEGKPMEEESFSSGDGVQSVDRPSRSYRGEAEFPETGHFQVPDIDNGWDLGFDSDEEDAGKPSVSSGLFGDKGFSSGRERGSDSGDQEHEQDDGMMPALVDKSACFENSSPQRRREVYKMPVQGEESDSHILLWPVGVMINTIGFQVKMIGYTVSIAMLLLQICYSMITEPIHRTVEAKNKVTGRISHGISLITHARLMLWEAASELGPRLNKLAKRIGYGLLAAAYICVVMSSLLVPAVLIDVMFVSRIVEEPVEIRESLHFDYTEPHPSALIPLFPQVVIPRQKPYTGKNLKVRSIPTSHRFHITATLKLPESDHNMRLGMFQVTAEILSVNGLVLARFTQPCMLRYRSPPIRYAKTLMMAVPLVLGLDVESQTLVLTLVESYEDKGSNHAGSAKIMLEPRAGFPPGAGLPELYDAEVLVQSELPPFKSLVYNWKWTFYVWSGMLLFILEVAFVVCCCRQVLLLTPRTSTSGGNGGNGDGDSDTRAAGGEENVIRRPIRKKKVSFQDELPRARAAAAGVGTRPSDIDSFVQKELEALSGTKEKLSSVQEGESSDSRKR